MNKSKKIIKEQGLQTPDKKEMKEQAKSRKNLILIIIGAIIILGGVFVVCYTQLRPRAILTVEGPAANGETKTDTVYYSDAMYDIYQMESMYNSYGMDWDSDNGTGTLSESVKSQVMDTIKQREVLCMQAEKDAVTLTDEEQAEVDTSTEEAMNNLAEDAKGKKGLSQSDIRVAIEKEKLADKEKEQIISGLNIDEESVKSSVNKKDFRQYDFQYYSFPKTEETTEETEGAEGSDSDAEQEPKQKDAAALKKGKADMEALLKKAKTAEDFSKLITDSDEDQKDDETGIIFGTKEMLETDTDFGDDTLRLDIKNMENDEMSSILETPDAYYLIKMTNNDDPAAYDKEVENKLSSEKESQFNTYYKDTLVKQYTIKVQDYWKDLVNIGHITTEGTKEQQQ